MNISENDIYDPSTEEPENPEGSDNGNNNENEENNGTTDPSGSGGEESGNGDGTDAPETGGGDETGGGGSETPPDVEAPETKPDYSGDILDRLDSVVSALGDSPDYDSLADSFRILTDVVAKQTETLETLSASSVPVSGYRDYSYPVHVEYRIFPTALGSETGVSNDYDTPEDFESGYAFMVDSVAQGNLAYFNIRYITDATGTTVYDGTVAEEPEEPKEPEQPEEPDTFKDDVLAALAALNDNLNTVSANDLGYHEQSLDIQEQSLKLQEQLNELQQETVQLHYGILAGTLVMSFTLLFTLGYTVAHGFLQRMKVG